MEHDNMFARIIKSKWIYILLLLAFTISSEAQTKRGLIIAIGDYPETGHTPRLAGHQLGK